MSSQQKSGPNGSSTENDTSAKRRQANGRRNQKTTNQFKGETAGMMGHVFRLLSEHSKKVEFRETMDALERYAGRNYALDTAKLQTLFKELKTPTYDEPSEPGSKKRK